MPNKPTNERTPEPWEHQPSTPEQRAPSNPLINRKARAAVIWCEVCQCHHNANPESCS